MHCDLDLLTQVNRAHPCLVVSVPVKFHEDRYKGEAVMRMKPFYLTHALWFWPLDPKVNRAHPWLMGNVPAKSREDRCKGEAVMRMNPFYLTMHLQTGRLIPVYPPNFVAGALNKCGTMQIWPWPLVWRTDWCFLCPQKWLSWRSNVRACYH